MIQGRGFLWSMWLKEARASSMFLKEGEASSFWCLYLLLLLEEEMELEWLLDSRDGRIIPVIFIWHRWKWDSIKKGSEPRLTAAAIIIIDLPPCFSFSLWSRVFGENSLQQIWKIEERLTRDGWVSIEKETLTRVDTPLKRWRFEEEETANLPLIQSSPVQICFQILNSIYFQIWYFFSVYKLFQMVRC